MDGSNHTEKLPSNRKTMVELPQSFLNAAAFLHKFCSALSITALQQDVDACARSSGTRILLWLLVSLYVFLVV